jgi:glycosyltransferase involved in cell wall biosynthesis
MNEQGIHRTVLSDLRVLVCGTTQKQYPRDDTLWEGLSRLDVEKLIDMRRVQDYIETRQAHLSGRSDKAGRKVFSRLAFEIRVFRYALSIMRTARREKVNIVFVFSRNHHLAIVLGLLRFYHKASVYFDLHYSRYSAATANSFKKSTVVKNWINEFLCIRLANRLICLTEEYAEYYQRTYMTRINKFSVVHDGVQDVWFEEPASAGSTDNPEGHKPMLVLYWGGFLIQHGLDIIIGAAEELKDKDIKFVLAGGGWREAYAREEVDKKRLSNVNLVGFIPTTRDLIHLVDRADVTLGQLKDTHDVRLAAANKTKQGMARCKPVIAIWTKQKEDLYRTEGNTCSSLIMIKNVDRDSLAKAILDIMCCPQEAKRIGNAAREVVEKIHRVEMIASALRESFRGAIE